MTDQGRQNIKKLIIVAEDDQYYADIYKSKLTQEGFEVMITENGEETLKAAREKKPDLILLDLVMPIKDGFEVLEELMMEDSLKSVKVIVFSNLGKEEDVDRAKKLGAAEYLVKANTSIQEMVNYVKEALK